MSSFGALLRQYRLVAGLSQETLAERARMSVEGVSALERGYRRNPQRQTVAALGSALGLSAEALREFAAVAQPDCEPIVAHATGEARLPIALSTFIGRRDEIEEISAMLRAHRLVTIVGSGGVGKTQTALRAASGLRGSGIFGTRFVGLASLHASASVLAAIASVLGIQEQTGRSLEHAVLTYLRKKNLALVLDNCEHVVEGARAAVAELLHGCPRLHVLATSRESLKVDGERTYRLPSMRPTEALALFVDRARAIDHSFAPTAQNEPVVEDICRRLDGIPLAIELAAARVNVLSVAAIAERLDDRFRILTGLERGTLPRHRTMRATIDWSYELLKQDERDVYEFVSIFGGGCTLEGAVAVAPPGALQSTMLDLLSSLVNKSLLTVNFAGAQPRYRLLESFRRHAYEKLEARGETETAARRHAHASLAVAEELSAAADWNFSDLEPELENARAAIEWALAAGEIPLASRIACGFTLVWRMNRGDAQPRRWLEALLPKLDENAEPEVAAQVWRTLSSLLIGSAKIAAAERALELATLCASAYERVAALYQLTGGFVNAGRLAEAASANAAAMRICRENAMLESRRYAGTLGVQGVIATRYGRFEEARTAYSEALALTRHNGGDVELTNLSHNLAELEFILGNTQRALQLANEAVASARRTRFTRIEAISLANLAAYSLALDDLDGAWRAAHDALEIAQDAYPMGAAVAIQHLATVAALRGDARSGARLCGYVNAWYRARGCERDLTEARGYERLLGSLHERLDAREIETLAAAGAALPEDRAALEALEL